MNIATVPQKLSNRISFDFCIFNGHNFVKNSIEKEKMNPSFIVMCKKLRKS